jgi:Protein  of unknown function (DUF3018)
MPRLKKAVARKGGPKRARKVVVKRAVGPKSATVKRSGPKSGRPKRAVAKADGLSKFQRFRRAQARKGMKLLRIWVPDPSSPEFAAEAERQARLLRGRPEEEDAIRFAEAVFADGMTDEPDYGWSKS